MRHRYKIAVAVIALLCVGIWLLLRQTPPAAPVSASPTPSLQPAPAAIAVATSPGASSPVPSAAPLYRPAPPAPSPPPLIPSAAAGTRPSPPATSPPALEIHIAVEAVRNAVQKYGATFGGNPVGTNAEITRALNGNNPTHSRFLDGIPGAQVDANGSLIDQWGTPYFFHQLSATDMEVRSAGPDRIMWTSDDIILQ